MTVERVIKEAISSSLDKINLSGIDFDLDSGNSIQGHGDYATNVALVAFSQNKSYPEAKTPLELAEVIAKTLEKNFSGKETVDKIEVAPPGFINFYLSERFYKKLLVKVINKGDDFGRQIIGRGKTVVIDYSAPNIAKPFGVGHLRSTIIGQALYNIFAFLGYRAVGDNHLGDWGTQFGVLLHQIDQQKIDPKKLTMEDLEKLYVDFYQKLGQEPRLQEKARSYFKRLELGEQKLKNIWRDLVNLSLFEYQKVYSLLKVNIDFSLGESFYQDKMKAVLDEAKNKNLVIKSKGALIMPLEDSPVPAMLVKSDGATTYLLRDLATIKYRVERWNPELIIYEVGADHKLHFTQTFEAAEKLDYIKRERLVHVAHGMIRGRLGKLSTRGGRIIHLGKVLKEAIDRARQLSTQAGIAKDLPIKGQEKVARVVGIGAVKYNDLKQNPRTNIVFDWQKILTLEGNSGPYLQYTYARARRVLEKSGTDTNLTKIPEYQPKREELAITRLICYFEKVINESARTFSPNLIANLLYQLAQNYNTFYNQHQILTKNKEAKAFRLLLSKATAQVLKNGLGLLGIEAPEKM
ncbi:MAG: arginine--tRNA ligase [Candidatus Shapirobacteria bacterium]|nr:arginine--tRNA ligase [Candidatus Shapirobacteria bacterium]